MHVGVQCIAVSDVARTGTKKIIVGRDDGLISVFEFEASLLLRCHLLGLGLGLERERMIQLDFEGERVSAVSKQ